MILAAFFGLAISGSIIFLGIRFARKYGGPLK